MVYYDSIQYIAVGGQNEGLTALSAIRTSRAVLVQAQMGSQRSHPKTHNCPTLTPHNDPLKTVPHIHIRKNQQAPSRTSRLQLGSANIH